MITDWFAASGVGIIFGLVLVWLWAVGTATYTKGFWQGEVPFGLGGMSKRDVADNPEFNYKSAFSGARRFRGLSIIGLLASEVLGHMLQYYDYINNESIGRLLILETSFPLFVFLSWWFGKKLVDNLIYKKWGRLEEENAI